MIFTLTKEVKLVFQEDLKEEVEKLCNYSIISKNERNNLKCLGTEQCSFYLITETKLTDVKLRNDISNMEPQNFS